MCLQGTPVLAVPVAMQLSQSRLSRKVPTTIILISQSLQMFFLGNYNKKCLISSLSCAEDTLDGFAHLPLVHPFPCSLSALSSPGLMAIPALSWFPTDLPSEPPSLTSFLVEKQLSLHHHAARGWGKCLCEIRGIWLSPTNKAAVHQITSHCYHSDVFQPTAEAYCICSKTDMQILLIQAASTLIMKRRKTHRNKIIFIK